jgi:hypothetical protein
MRTLLISAAIAAALAIPQAQSRESELQQALRRPNDATSGPLLLAQRDRPQPRCKDDAREVPVGATTCRQGRHLVCGPRGDWEDSGKPC